MEFIKPFYGCKTGDIYPTRFNVGDECPAELIDAAASVGAIASPKKGKSNGKSGDDSKS